MVFALTKACSHPQSTALVMSSSSESSAESNTIDMLAFDEGLNCLLCLGFIQRHTLIFNHLIEKHNAETFKIKKLKFCEKEGVLGYATVYWRRVSGVSKRVFATIKSKPMPAKLQTQYCYLHYNVFRRKRVSKELCLGSLRNASVVYIIWLIFTADIKFLFSFPI
jgi:hypothetical protein